MPRDGFGCPWAYAVFIEDKHDSEGRVLYPTLYAAQRQALLGDACRIYRSYSALLNL